MSVRPYDSPYGADLQMPDAVVTNSDEVLPDFESPRTDDRDVATVHRTFRVLAYATLVALLISILVNWWFVRGIGEALPSAGSGSVSGVPDPGEVTLDAPAVDYLPDRILQYETITRQPIPGLGDRAAEAVYRTLNMNLEAQIEIIVYARVEGFASGSGAQERQAELMAQYTRETSSGQLGGAAVSRGFTSDKGAYAISWTDGQYVTFIKSSYAEWIPAIQKDLVVDPGERIADAVEVYQRTGRQGVSK